MTVETLPETAAPSKKTGEDALANLTALVQADLELCNRLIVERMHSNVPLIPELAAHLIAAGGKRLRPLLTLAAANLCGYRGERHASLAACVEFIHTATLLHDDVVDESDLRRGQASANAIFGNKASVLVGDFLFTRAFQLMVADGSLKVLDILSRASATIAEGEVLQLTMQSDLSSTEAQYLEMIEGKTAALFAAATRVGAVIADRPEAEETALDTYGHALGIAFQLVDDALDYSAEQAKLGKTVGDDFREGKITLPVLVAHARGSEEEKAFWQRVIEAREQEEGDLEEALRLMRAHGALDETGRRAREYGQRAIGALDVFPESAMKSAMREVVRFVVDRAH